MTGYAWGRPAEAFLAAATRKEYADITSETSLRTSWVKCWAEYLASSGGEAMGWLDAFGERGLYISNVLPVRAL